MVYRKLELLSWGWWAFYTCAISFIGGFVIYEYFRYVMNKSDDPLYFYMLATGKGNKWTNGSGYRWFATLCIVGLSCMISSVICIFVLIIHQVEMDIAKCVPIRMNLGFYFANYIKLISTGLIVACWLSCVHHYGKIADLRGIESYVINYDKDPGKDVPVKSALDSLQINYECCGHERYDDWFEYNPYWIRTLMEKEDGMDTKRKKPDTITYEELIKNITSGCGLVTESIRYCTFDKYQKALDYLNETVKAFKKEVEKDSGKVDQGGGGDGGPKQDKNKGKNEEYWNHIFTTACKRYGVKDAAKPPKFEARCIEMPWEHEEIGIPDVVDIVASVPFSCCRKGLNRPCINEDIYALHDEYQYPEALTVYTNGCTPTLKEALQNRLIISFIVYFIMAALELVVLFFFYKVRYPFQVHIPRKRKKCMKRVHYTYQAPKNKH